MVIHIKKSDTHNKLRLKINKIIYSILPSLIGLITFLVIIRYASTEVLMTTLPAYQCGLTFSTIIFLGLSYCKNKIEIKVFKYIIIIILSTFIFLIININSILQVNDKKKLILLYIIIVSYSILQYLILNKNGVIALQKLGIFFSITGPLLILISFNLLLVIYLITFLIILFLIKRQNIIHIDSSNYREPVISVTAQIIYLIYPIFDLTLLDIIGLDKYTQYVSISKITTGVGLFLFSYFQLQVLEGTFKLTTTICNPILFMLSGLFCFFSLFLPDLECMILQSVLVSFIVNISSIVTRIAIKNNIVKKRDLVISISLILSYGIFIIMGKKYEFENLHRYFLIFIFGIFYLNLLIYRKRVVKFE